MKTLNAADQTMLKLAGFVEEVEIYYEQPELDDPTFFLKDWTDIGDSVREYFFLNTVDPDACETIEVKGILRSRWIGLWRNDWPVDE